MTTTVDLICDEINNLPIGGVSVYGLDSFSAACVKLKFNMWSNGDGTTTCISRNGKKYIWTTKLSEIERIK